MTTRLSVLMIGAALGVAVLVACGGITIPPEYVDYAICLATCDGQCVATEGGYYCRPITNPCDQCTEDQVCEGGVCVPKPPDPVDPCDGQCKPTEVCLEDEEANECGLKCRPKDTPPLVRACWSKAPGETEWTWIPAAPPPPPGDSGCGVEAELEGSSGCQPEYHDQIFAATRALGDRTGQKPRKNLEALKERFEKDTGICTIAGVEANFMVREDGRWDEYHTVYFGDGSWTNSGRGRYIGCHRDKRTTDVGLPHPDPRPHLKHAKFQITEVTRPGYNLDTTFLITRDHEYCLSIRMGKHGNLPRASCPVRPDSHKDREPWERAVLGTQRHFCDGAEIAYANNNPAQASCHGAHYKTCSEDLSICSEKELR